MCVVLYAKDAKMGQSSDVLVIVVLVPNTSNLQSLGGHNSCTLEMCFSRASHEN